MSSVHVSVCVCVLLHLESRCTHTCTRVCVCVRVFFYIWNLCTHTRTVYVRVRVCVLPYLESRCTHTCTLCMCVCVFFYIWNLDAHTHTLCMCVCMCASTSGMCASEISRIGMQGRTTRSRLTAPRTFTRSSGTKVRCCAICVGARIK